jgi:tetratricopeptide (TPR) repeat protein
MRALVALRRKEYDYAEQLLQDSIAVMRSLNPSGIDVGILLTDLSTLERACGRFDKAAQYLREELQIAENLESKVDIAIVYNHMGALSIDRKRWAEAREWTEKALSLAREIGRQDLISTVQYVLARAYEGEGQLELALPPAQEALAIELKLRSRNLPGTRELVERLKKKLDAPESAS